MAVVVVREQTGVCDADDATVRGCDDSEIPGPPSVAVIAGRLVVLERDVDRRQLAVRVSTRAPCTAPT